MTALTFTQPSCPGLTFEARPLSEPPAPGSIALLYGSHRLLAVGKFDGDVWEIVHRRFAGEPTHWVVGK